MPCYTVAKVTTPLEWGIKTDIGLLRLALEDMGFAVTAAQNIGLLTATHPDYGIVTYSNGKLEQTARTYNSSLNSATLKQAYNKRVVHQQAKKMGWRCPQPGTPAYAKNDWSVSK